MPLTRDSVKLASDRLAEAFRQLAKEQPASGKMLFMTRAMANDAFWGITEKVSRSHMNQARKFRATGNIPFALFHLGAAAALATSPRFKKGYTVFVNHVMKEAENG